jgi:hypothetical protein
MRLANSSKGTKQLMGDVTLFGSILGPALIGMGKFVVILALISGKVPPAAIALRALGIAFRFVWKSVFLPIAIILTAITVFKLAYKHSVIFRKSMQFLGKILEKVFVKPFALIKALIHGIGWIISKIAHLHAASGALHAAHSAIATTSAGTPTSGISMGAGTALAKPSILQTAIQHVVKSTLDINVQDPGGVVKSVAGSGDHDMSLNLGTSMMFSRV